MELVRGVPITEFCDRQQLDTRARLSLFVAVCQAVQHAHQKGVIHRDLKPSNVLVTLHDGTPVVKVIDFGVAKAIGHSLTDKTIYTRFTAMIGTPLYMSPEQAEMSGLDVDTRSDIYSLGVLLYELVTGATPFDQQRMQRAGLDELRRILREEEPPRPSARISTLGETLSTVSASRRTEPSKLTALVRGDLDWIVMKAIEKDRGRRYATAAGLAADVLRHLSDEPVEARPPSPLYRFRKFARRHKVTIATVTLVAAAMILGTGLSVWQAARAVVERNEKELALQEAVRARNDADRARREVEEFAERLKQANLLVTSGRAHADANRWYDAHVDYTRATELQPSYYLVWVERGSLYARLGLWKSAADDYAKAVELGAPTDGPGSWGVPQLLYFSGDERRYREVCEPLGRKVVGSTGNPSWNAIRSCLLAPAPVVDPAALAEQAESLLDDVRKRGPDATRRFPPGLRQPPDGFRPPRGLGASPGFGRPPVLGPRDAGPSHGPARAELVWLPHGASLYIAGWAHYRAGHFERAIDRLERSHHEDPGWPGRGISDPVLAMACHRSGRGDDARRALAAADQRFGRWAEELSQGALGSMPIPWFDWIEFLVLYREARILITGFAPPDDPRLRNVTERGLAAIQNRDGAPLP